MKDKHIYVTQPFLPPLEEFIPYLEKIWESKQLTNNGPLHQQLEQKLAEYLGVPYVVLTNNGMSALLIAAQALELTGEVITTPYSFVATTHAITLNNLKPVFVDIDPVSFNLDPSKIEAAVTDKTTAILPVHCYGNPCDHDAIQAIADKYNLKVLYDAAHAFGVKDKQGSILNYGDLSILSFHATKVFSTFEGGAVICHTEAMYNKLCLLKNFGIANETTVCHIAVNAKLNEVSAAMGLLQLQYIDTNITQRENIDALYRRELAHVKGIDLLPISQSIRYNYAYFSILITNEYGLSRDELYEKLKEQGIFGRRYFYPLISDMEPYKSLNSGITSDLRIAKKIADQVLCLPIYPGLTNHQVEKVIEVIKDEI